MDPITEILNEFNQARYMKNLHRKCIQIIHVNNRLREIAFKLKDPSLLHILNSVGSETKELQKRIEICN